MSFHGKLPTFRSKMIQVPMRQLILLSLLVFAGCATAPVPEKKVEPAPTPSPAVEADEAANDDAAADESLPKQDLTEDVLFQYLVARVAAQRGDLLLAVNQLINLATSTGDPRFAEEATRTAVDAEDPILALRAGRVWAELRPDSIKAQRIFAVLLIENHRFEEAGKRVKILLAEAKDPAAGFINLTGLLAPQADHKAALQLMQGLAADYPSLAEAHFSVATLARLAGEHQLAMAEAEKAHALKPDWERVVVFLAEGWLKQEPAKAMSLVEGYLAAHPGAQQARLMYARLLAGQREYEKAREQFKILSEALPDNAEVSFAIGMLSLELKDWTEAQSMFRKALAQKYGSPDAVHYFLARALEGEGKMDQAMAEYAEVDKGEYYLTAQIQIADRLRQEGKMDQALAFLAKTHAEGHEAALALIQAQARLLRDAKRYDEAMAVLDKALKEYPDEPDLLYDRSMVAEKLDRIDIAERDLRRVIELAPDNAQAYNALGYTLADRTERFDEADKFLRKAMELKPDDAYILDSVGWLAYRRGKAEESLPLLEKAYSLMADPEIAAHLGEVLWSVGRKSDAKDLLLRAQKEHPDNEVLRRAAARILK